MTVSLILPRKEGVTSQDLHSLFKCIDLHKHGERWTRKRRTPEDGEVQTENLVKKSCNVLRGGVVVPPTDDVPAVHPPAESSEAAGAPPVHTRKRVGKGATRRTKRHKQDATEAPLGTPTADLA